MANTPNAQNVTLGSGEWFFNRFDPVTGANVSQWLSLGMAKKGQVSISGNAIELRNHMRGARGMYAAAVVESGGKVSIDTSEMDIDILAAALLGTTTALAQTAGTATSQAITGTVKLGFALSTGKYNITVTSVTKGVTPLVLGTDYDYDSTSGLIRILSTATVVVAGDSITWSGSYAAITAQTRLLGLTNAVVQGQLKFVPASDQIGPRYVYDFFKVLFSPKAALDTIGDQFTQVSMEFDMLEDQTRVASATQSRYFEMSKIA